VVEGLVMCPATSPVYAPRNALNANRLKADITARSRARGDSDAVRGWLLNHFYRHIVSNFEPARPIASHAEACAVLDTPPPAWVTTRFGAAGKLSALAPVVWIDPAQPQLLALEARLVEFLESRKGTRLDGKLDRINCPQALALWEKEHADMAQRIARGWRQSQPDAIRTWLETPHGRFVEFLQDSAHLRAEMAFESYVMRHCLGQFRDRKALTGGYGQRYAQEIEAGRLRLLSFRDPGGQPHITVSAVVRGDGRLDVDQIKGKQNRPPVERYIDDVLACLNALDTGELTPPDGIAIGIVRTPAGWRRIENVLDAASQTRLVGHHPQLYRRLTRPTPAVEWLVAARQPELLRDRPPCSAAVRYAARAMLGAATTPHDGAATTAYATECVPWPQCDASYVDGGKQALAR
jgi:hypothetical protein